MAKSTLPVNFKDDIMNSSMGGLRRYKMINNSDATVSFEDATSYDQVGSNFGAGQANATNQAVNAAADAGKIIDDMDTIRNVTQEGYIAGALALKQVHDSLSQVKTYVGEDGKLHFVDSEGADSVLPFSSGLDISEKATGTISLTNYNQTIDTGLSKINALFIYIGALYGNGYADNVYLNGEHLLVNQMTLSVNDGSFTVKSNTVYNANYIAFGVK